jgi:hypothetical protein
VWYNPKSLINILSFANVSRKFRVTFDSSINPAIIVHVNKHRTLKFEPLGQGLYTCDRKEFIKTKKSVSNYSFLTSVSDNIKSYTRREIEGAKLARVLYRALNYPLYIKLIKLLETHNIWNSPLTSDDVKHSLHIWGPDVASIKGKMTQTKGTTSNFEYLALPLTILDTSSSIITSTSYSTSMY